MVDSSSLLFRVFVALDCLAVPEPHHAFMALLEDPQTELLLQGLCLVTVGGGPGTGYSGVVGSDTGPAENSSLNFQVRAVGRQRAVRAAGCWAKSIACRACRASRRRSAGSWPANG